MIAEVERAMRFGLGCLNAVALDQAMFPSDHAVRNILLRTVRYIEISDEPVGREIVSGHADLGLTTLHLYETHAGWFEGAPFSSELIIAKDTNERRKAVRAMRKALRPIEAKERNAVFFAGANWATFPSEFIPEDVRDLPACYHAGFKPDEITEQVSEYAGAVTEGEDQRVSVIAFGHPNIELIRDGVYRPATVEMCRPEYGE